MKCTQVFHSTSGNFFVFKPVPHSLTYAVKFFTSVKRKRKGELRLSHPLRLVSPLLPQLSLYGFLWEVKCTLFPIRNPRTNRTTSRLISQPTCCFYIWKELNLLVVFNTIRKIFFRDRIRFVEPVRTKGYSGSCIYLIYFIIDAVIAILTTDLYSAAVAVADPYATKSVILINTAIISSTESISTPFVKV